MFGNNDHQKHKLGGVNCMVNTCQYHGASNSCTAGQIRVGTEYADDKTETFCSTYEHKPGL